MTKKHSHWWTWGDFMESFSQSADLGFTHHIAALMFSHPEPFVISWAQLNMPTKAFFSSMRDNIMMTDV